MKKLQLPFVNLPSEFVTLLKSNLNVTTSPAPVFDIVRPNRALMTILENGFKEFDDGRGVEKVMLALGWSNFRERMASIYVYKTIFGAFPGKTDMELVQDIIDFENRFTDHGVHSISRAFLLGFYLKLANFELQRAENNQFLEIKVPESVGSMLKLSQGRAEKIDWLILILTHLNLALGEKMIMNALVSGKKFEDLYQLMPLDMQELMNQNLLAYGASIHEGEIFLYEKV